MRPLWRSPEQSARLRGAGVWVLVTQQPARLHLTRESGGAGAEPRAPAVPADCTAEGAREPGAGLAGRTGRGEPDPAGLRLGLLLLPAPPHARPLVCGFALFLVGKC